MNDETRTATRAPAADPALAETMASGDGAAREPLADLVGAHLGGRYRVTKMLGKGGMGAVYLAVDEVLGQEFALKRVTRHVDLEMLRSEVLLAQKITHPNVCRTWDLEELDGNFFVKMEHVDGETLAARLSREQKLSAAETVRIARVVCAGLAAAHARGVIHCDLKPHNILVEKSTGRIVLTDFGVARAADEERPSGGTPQYMAPEQVRGLAVDGRTDLYGLGCVLHHLLIGQVPFPAASSEEAARRQLDDPPPDLKAIPRGLATLITRLLQKDPAARPASANEVLALLDAPRRARRRLTVAGAAVFALAVASLVTWRATRRPPAWRPDIVERQPSYEENANLPIISPDGKWLAYTSDREGEGGIFVEPLEGGPAHRIGDFRQIIIPNWAADSRALVGSDDLRRAWRVPIDGGPAEPLGENIVGVDRCGDSLLFVPQSTPECPSCARLILRARDGGERELYRAAPDVGIMFARCDAAGKQVAWAQSRIRRGLPWFLQPGDLWVMRTDDGSPRRLTADGRYNLYPVFPGDGRTIVFSSSRGGRRNLWEISVDGSGPSQITFGEGPDVAPDVAPDGRRLLYLNDDCAMPLFATSLASSGEPRRLTATQDLIPSIEALPDGKSLLAISLRDEGAQLILLSLDGSRAMRELGPGDAFTLLPDGRTLLVAVNEGERSRIEALVLDAGSRRALRDLDGSVRHLFRDPDGTLFVAGVDAKGALVWRISPDGSVREDRAFNMIMPAPRGGWTLAEPSGVNHGLRTLRLYAPGQPIEIDRAPAAEVRGIGPAWTMDGSGLIFGQVREVRRFDVASRSDRVIAPISVSRAISLSPDGKTLYTSQPMCHSRRMWIRNFGERPR
jgi:Tol biopolymer transport system component